MGRPEMYWPPLRTRTTRPTPLNLSPILLLPLHQYKRFPLYLALRTARGIPPYYPRTGVQRAGSLRSLKTRRATLFLPTSELVLLQVARSFVDDLTATLLCPLLCTPSLCSRLSHVSRFSHCSSPSPSLPTLCVFSPHLSFFSMLTDPFRSIGRANDWYRRLHSQEGPLLRRHRVLRGFGSVHELALVQERTATLHAAGRPGDVLYVLFSSSRTWNTVPNTPLAPSPARSSPFSFTVLLNSHGRRFRRARSLR